MNKVQSRSRFHNTLKIPIRYSRWLFVGLLGSHIGAALLLSLLHLPLAYKLFIISGIFFSLIYYLYQHVFFLGNWQPKCLYLLADGQWRLDFRDGRCCEIQLLSNILVHPFLTVLSIRVLDCYRSLIFTPDMIEPDSFRQLRVRLRYLKLDRST